MVEAGDWKELAAEKKQRQRDSIPKQWVISTPSDAVLDVTTLPEECGLLSSKELEITNATVDGLLKNLAAGTWSSVEVTTAFYKRAVIAHQLVSSCYLLGRRSDGSCISDKLFNRNLR